MKFRLRRAVESDAAAVAAIHHQAWLETYQGLLPDHFLSSLSIERSLAVFQKSRCRNLAVAEGDHGMIGFCGWGDFRDAVPYENIGEVQGIYLLAEVQRQGIGGKLLNIALADLAEQGKTSVGLFVLSTNKKAISFYKKHGFTDSGMVKQADLGTVVTEKLYVKHLR